MLIRISESRAPLAFGIIQAGLTSLIASGIGVYQIGGFGDGFASRWIMAWLSSWMLMLPVVIFAAPHIQRLVRRMIIAPDVLRPHARATERRAAD